MSASALITGILLLAAPSAGRATLTPFTTLSAASPRPSECRPRPTAVESELWSRTRGETTRRYCSLLARGYARLERSPAQALTLGLAAAAIFPAAAEPRVLAGRARVRLAQWEAARTDLERSVDAEGRPLGDVDALRELALALAATGHVGEAAATYRLLVPRADFARDRLFARVVVLEAATASMANGPAGLDEALSYLGDARQKPPVPGLEDLTTALFALALDRAGKRDEAEVILRALAGPWTLERFLSPEELSRIVRLALPGAVSEPAREQGFAKYSPHLVAGELHAAIALAGLTRDAKLARAHLRAYIEGPGAGGAWIEWAKGKLLGLPKAREATP